MKTLIVGQAPARDTVGKAAFSGRSGPRFASMLGCAHSDLWSTFEVTNLLDFFPGSSQGENDRGDKFPIFEARQRATRMIGTFAGRTIVFVGKNVARAFGFARAEYFEWYDAQVPKNGDTISFRFCIVPHPSGINHFWNNPENLARAGEFMKKIPR